MTSNATRLIRLVLSALVAGVMGAGTYLLGAGVMTDGTLKPGTTLIATILGVMALAKDVQSYLSTVPIMPAPPAPEPPRIHEATH